MSVISVLFVAWLIYSLVRGYQKGLWLGLVDLLAFVAAYGLSYLWGPLLNDSLNLSGLKAIGGYLSVYLVIYTGLGLLPKIVFARSLKTINRLALAGAGLGLITGVVSGLVLVWAFQFLSSTAAINGAPSHELAKTSAGVEAAVPESSPVVKTANQLMGKVSRVGAGLTGADPLQAELAGRFAEAPAQMMRDMRELGNSRELQAFINSSQIQRSMQANNIDAIIESPEYHALLKLPALASMRAVALAEVARQPSDTRSPGDREADYYLAEQIAGVWQKMSSLRSEPEVQALLADAELKTLIEKKDFAGLMTNRKARQLFNKILSHQVSDAGPLPVAGKEQSQAGQSEPAEPRQIYKWRDDSGQVRYSDEPPPEGRESLDKIQYK